MDSGCTLIYLSALVIALKLSYTLLVFIGNQVVKRVLYWFSLRYFAGRRNFSFCNFRSSGFAIELGMERLVVRAGRVRILQNTIESPFGLCWGIWWGPLILGYPSGLPFVCVSLLCLFWLISIIKGRITSTAIESGSLSCLCLFFLEWNALIIHLHDLCWSVWFSISWRLTSALSISLQFLVLFDWIYLQALLKYRFHHLRFFICDLRRAIGCSCSIVWTCSCSWDFLILLPSISIYSIMISSSCMVIPRVKCLMLTISLNLFKAILISLDFCWRIISASLLNWVKLIRFIAVLLSWVATTVGLSNHRLGS
jgi:hypothetical protein